MRKSTGLTPRAEFVKSANEVSRNVLSGVCSVFVTKSKQGCQRSLVRVKGSNAVHCIFCKYTLAAR